MVDTYPHRTWCDADGRALSEDYEITGLAHGTPLATRGEGAVGEAMPHMLEAGISSTRHIAVFWEIARGVWAETALPAVRPDIPAQVAEQSPARRRETRSAGASKIIEGALRGARLMR